MWRGDFTWQPDITTITSNSGSTSGTNELTLATSATLDFDGTMLTEVSFSWYNTQHTVGTDVFLVRLYQGSTQIAQWLPDITTNGCSGNIRRVLTPAAGTHSFTARLVRSSGTGTALMVASSVLPAQLLVRRVA